MQPARDLAKSYRGLRTKICAGVLTVKPFFSECTYVIKGIKLDKNNIVILTLIIEKKVKLSVLPYV